MQHRPCSNVVNPNLIFNCGAKIKTCLNKRNTYRIGTNDILKCAANGLLLLVVDTATLRHKLMTSRKSEVTTLGHPDDFGSPDVTYAYTAAVIHMISNKYLLLEIYSISKKLQRYQYVLADHHTGNVLETLSIINFLLHICFKYFVTNFQGTSSFGYIFFSDHHSG